MQYTAILTAVKNETLRHIIHFCLNIDRGYALEMRRMVNPTFSIWKSGLKGSKLHGHASVIQGFSGIS